MKKLAMALAAILIMNLAAPAASVYAAPDETVTETVAEDLTESTEEADTVDEGESILPDSSEENTETFVEEVLLSEATEAETESSGEESESVMETEEVIEETVVEEIVTEEQTQEETPVLIEWVGVDTTSGNNLVTETPESDFEWDGETIIKKYIGTAETVVIPQRAQKISANAFKGNTTITSVTITSNINSIGDNAFYNCSGLKSVKFETTKLGTNCGGNIFQGCSLNSVTFAEGMTTIPNHLFINAGFESGAGIVIPEGVTEIGADAFQDAVNLSSVTFAGNKVVTIKEDAFLGTGIEEIDLPESVKVIEAEAFRSCMNLREITIPQNVTTLGGSVFCNCSGLKSVKFETTKLETRCGGNNFQGCSINSVTFAEGTTYIPGNLFICAGFESGMGIVIPEEVTEIGADAFQEAANLSSVTFAGNKVVTIKEDAFLGTGIEEIDLPESVKVIEAEAFYNCTNLREITIPQNVTTLGGSVFCNCSGLKSVKFETTKLGTRCGGNNFQGCSINSVTFAEGTTYIPGNLFICAGFESGMGIVIPEGVTEIGADAFQEAANLSSVTFAGNKVVTIKEDAFLGTGIEEIDLPESVKVIEAEAFYNCTNLREITIPQNVTTLGGSVFCNCSGLKSVKFETTKLGTRCGGNNFQGCSINSVTFAEGTTYIPGNLFICAGFESGMGIVIPEEVTEIGADAFQEAVNLSSVTFAGNKVVTIKEDAFLGTGIEEIDLPESVKVIEAQAFYNCDKLTEITIPNKVTTLGNEVFWACDSLERVILPSKIKNMGRNLFSKNSFLKIYAPKGSASYKWAKKNGYTVGEIFTITYKLNGGVNGKDNPKNYEKGDILTFNDPTKTGFDFVGWYKDSKFKKPFTYSDTTSGNLTLYARWKAIQYPITYETNGGTLAKKSPLSYKITAAVALKNPSKAGYTFTGWYTSPELISETKITKIKKGNTGEKKLYAGWKANVYKIKFAKNAKNATGTMSAITGVVYDADVTLSSGAFARKGYTFEGWNTKANGRGTAIEDGATVKNLCTKNNGTVTLYAVWKAIPYTITYHLDGGNNSAKNPDSYTVAQTITFAKPKKTGYTFKGWYKDADLTQKISKIKAGSIGELELYAKWQVNKYTVVFNANKGKGKMVAMKNCEYNKTYQLSENLFKRNGYTFTGWNTKANGTGTAYGDLEEIENLTSVNQKKVILYAQWKKN